MRRWLGIAVLGASLYLALAHLAFALRHPYLTETERFLRTGDALLWK
jgi:CHASE1-domain containing sensor protein